MKKIKRKLQTVLRRGEREEKEIGEIGKEKRKKKGGGGN